MPAGVSGALVMVEQPEARRTRHRRRPVVDLQLAEGAHEVGLHCRLADEQTPARLRVRAALRHQPQNRRLPLREPRPLRSCTQPVHQSHRHRRREHGLATRGRPHRLRRLTPWHVLEPATGRASLAFPRRMSRSVSCVARSFTQHDSPASPSPIRTMESTPPPPGIRRSMSKGETAYGLAHRQPGESRFVLPDDSDTRPPRARAGRRVRPEHRHLARVPGAVALEDLHRGAPARASGPQQAEHLAPADPEIDAVHGGHVPVPLAQPPYVHREFVRVRCHAVHHCPEPNAQGRPCVLPYVHRTVDSGHGAAQWPLPEEGPTLKQTESA